MIFALLVTATIVVLVLAFAKPKKTPKYTHDDFLAVYGPVYKNVPMWAEPLVQLHPFEHTKLPRFVDWSGIPVAMWPAMFDKITQCERLLELLPSLCQTFPGIQTYMEQVGTNRVKCDMEMPLLLGILRGCCARLQGKVDVLKIKTEMRAQARAATLVYFTETPRVVDEYCEEIYAYADTPCNQGHLQLVLDIVNTDRLLL